MKEYEELVRSLVERLDTSEVPVGLTNEEEFEQQFVEEICTKVLRELHVATHPWGDPAKAKVWRDSKKWGAVTAWGLTHTLDLFARDPNVADIKSDSFWRLAVEVKLSKMRYGGKPTGDFQRMMGQCILARLRHNAVIAVFGYGGTWPGAAADEEHFAALRDDYGIWVVTKKVQLAA